MATRNLIELTRARAIELGACANGVEYVARFRVRQGQRGMRPERVEGKALTVESALAAMVPAVISRGEFEDLARYTRLVAWGAQLPHEPIAEPERIELVSPDS